LPEPSEFPNRLKTLREAQGLSLDDIADRLGVTNQQISLLELGRRKLTVDWLRRLAPVLGCHPWDLVEADAGIAASKIERKVLRAFRALDDDRRPTALARIEALAASKKSGRTRR
jgi:transcriptional regulator with XRE-family HTH domain